MHVLGHLGTALMLLVGVVSHPSLWMTALRAAMRFVPDDWWKQRPYLPIPDLALMRFRITTQYGDPEARIVVDDVLAWLRWCKAENVQARNPIN
ncbi:MAG: hypothetical protein KTU85_01075 [Acidimicrobiia bacterium]|nr:hypothetical protein [Acidimicrobiia bacterium]MCY4457182.1 hypothetical protein [Acidimicrobiaceae bacterium]